MTLEEGKRFLEGEGLAYTELHFDNEWSYWQEVCIWKLSKEGGENGPVTVLRIESPNGKRHLDLQFLKGEFLDLWFGGFGFELWESEDPPGDLRNYIGQVMRGGGWCDIWVNLKNNRWCGDGYYSEEDGDTGFREELAKLYAPKTRKERLFRTRLLCELYNWNEYHRIER